MEYYLVISAKFVPLKKYTLSSQLRRLTSFSVGCSGRRILSPGQIAVMRKWSIGPVPDLAGFRYHFVPFASHFTFCRYLVISIICDVMCYRSLLTLFQPFILFLKNSPVLGAGGGEKAKRSGKNTIRIKGQDSKPRSLKKSGQNQTQNRFSMFKDLLEEDSEEEFRPDPNHILAFTKTNHQLPASSVTMLLLSIICI